MYVESLLRWKRRSTYKAIPKISTMCPALYEDTPVVFQKPIRIVLLGNQQLPKILHRCEYCTAS